MKTRILGLVGAMLLTTSALFAQEKSEKIKVYGNCGMCETRIEKAASAVEGVVSAEWDKETKMLEVKYSGAKPDMTRVHQAVAKVGHDTDKYSADDAVYSKLPACCLYERPESKVKKQ